MKTTPWFSALQKPVRPGVYQRKLTLTHAILYYYWDGQTWWASGRTPDEADMMQGVARSYWQTRFKWRGVINE